MSSHVQKQRHCWVEEGLSSVVEIIQKVCLNEELGEGATGKRSNDTLE